MTKKKETEPQQNDLREIVDSLGTNVHRLVAFFSLYENSFVQGSLSSKVKHLIALSTAIGQRSDETTVHQVREALGAGATGDEIREAVTIAVFIAGIPSLITAVEALEATAQFEEAMMSSR